MNKKGLAVVLIGAIIILLGIGGYFVFVKKPVQVDTSNWKTYTNEKYGFEFKYPNGWVYQNYNFGVGEILEMAIDPNKTVSQKDLETIDISPGLVSVNIEKCATREGCHVIGYDNFEKVNIGEQNTILARKYETPVITNSPNPAYEGKHEINYYVDYGADNEYRATITYVSDVPDKYLNEFNQILSTFKFTQLVQVDTSNWKTYTNSQFGFEFKYPKEWKNVEDVTKSSMGHHLFDGQTGFFIEPEGYMVNGDIALDVSLVSIDTWIKDLKTANPNEFSALKDGQKLSLYELIPFVISGYDKITQIFIDSKKAFVVQSEFDASNCEGSPCLPSISKSVFIELTDGTVMHISFYLPLPDGSKLINISNQILSTLKFTD